VTLTPLTLAKETTIANIIWLQFSATTIDTTSLVAATATTIADVVWLQVVATTIET
jgi:Ni,Fe-hydrogenase I small subunit